MFQEYENLPPNHAPTYSDVQMDPLLAAIGGEMEQYANAEDRARYPGHMMYPMSPEMGEMSEATNLHGLYPSGGGGGTGWGGGTTGTGGGTGHSGYGYGAPYGSGAGGDDYHPTGPVHVPTGGSYSHHATAGSGYGGYAPPPPKYYSRPHPTVPTKGFVKKKHTASQSNASTMNALTLLAFFFFVNLLQNCLKENMEAINPTVMVMTSNMMRNRNTKLAEMNSREQSSSPASAFTSGANIVVQPETLVSAGSSSVVAGASGLASVTLQTSPYSDGGGGGVAVGVGAGVSSAVNVGNNYAGSAGVTSSNNQINNNNNNNHGSGIIDNERPAEPQYSYGTNGVNNGQQHQGGAAVIQNQHNNNMHSNNNNQGYGASNHGDSFPFSPTPTIITANPRPEFYEPPHLYPNQTINSATSLNQQHYYQQQLQQQHQQHQQRPYAPEQFEEEEYDAQVPQQQPPSQIQQHEHHAHNQFQQQQHYHDSRPNDNFAQQQQQQPDNHDDYHEHHHQQQPPHPPPPHDHFQHHYTAQHSQHQSSFHSHQHEENYGINRRPSSPNRGHSDASHPWSYSSATSPFRRGSSNSPLSSYTWSSDSLKSHVSGNNNFGDFDDDEERRYEDSFYTRSNRNL